MNNVQLERATDALAAYKRYGYELSEKMRERRAEAAERAAERVCAWVGAGNIAEDVLRSLDWEVRCAWLNQLMDAWLWTVHLERLAREVEQAKARSLGGMAE